MKNLINILSIIKKFYFTFGVYIGTLGKMTNSLFEYSYDIYNVFLKEFSIRNSYKNFNQNMHWYVNNLYIDLVFSSVRKRFVIALLSAFITIAAQIYFSTPVQAAGRVTGPAIDIILGDGVVSRFTAVVQSNPGLSASWQNTTGGTFELIAQKVAGSYGINIDPSSMFSEDLKCSDQPAIYSKESCVNFNGMLEQKYGKSNNLGKLNYWSKINVKPLEQRLKIYRNLYSTNSDTYLRFKFNQHIRKLARSGSAFMSFK